jgi:exopolysaccharide production protein ExoZ
MRAVRIDAIQIARFFAALLVVFDHALINLMSADRVAENHAFAFRTGGFGVVIFFLISGFVMSHSMYGTFAQEGAWKNFMVRRLVRITPLYWMVTLAIAAKGFATATLDSASPVLMSLAYIPYLAPSGEVQPLNGVGWTLNYEMQFYVIFALCLCFSRRVGIVLLSCILLGLVAFRDSLIAPIGNDFWAVAVGFWTDPIVLYFLGGVWLGILRGYLDRNQRSFDVDMRTLLISLLGVLICYETLLYHDLMPRWLEASFAVALMAALGLTNSAAGSNMTGTLKLLGDASYSTYLTHLFFLGALWKVAGPARIDMPPLAYLAIALVGASLVGLLVYKLVEKPVLARLQGWIARPPQLVPQQERS